MFFLESWKMSVCPPRGTWCRSHQWFRERNEKRREKKPRSSRSDVLSPELPPRPSSSASLMKAYFLEWSLITWNIVCFLCVCYWHSEYASSKLSLDHCLGSLRERCIALDSIFNRGLRNWCLNGRSGSELLLRYLAFPHFANKKLFLSQNCHSWPHAR